MVKQEKYSNVMDLMSDVFSDDDSFCDELANQIHQRQLVRKLARLRNQKKVPQSEIADALGCKQSRISKLENGFDKDVSIDDLAGYCRALDCELHVILRNSKTSIVDQIKEYAFGIKDCLKRLCSIAKKDDKISSGVAQFHVEAIMNLVQIVADSANELEGTTAKISYEVPNLDEPGISNCDDEILATSQ